MPPEPFHNRWLIEGTLLARGPLRVGDGTRRAHPALLRVRGDSKEEDVLVAAVATDHRGRAYVPGSTLKGCIRAGLRRAGVDARRIESLLGSADPEAPDSVGGRAEFLDAPMADAPAAGSPLADVGRGTDVDAAVSIDRRTRTARAQKLRHREYVPGGASFHVRIGGRNLSDVDVALLRAALASFRDDANGIRLGSDTGDGCGRVEWAESAVRRIRASDLANWLAQDAPPVGDEAATKVDIGPVPSALADAAPGIRIEIQLAFEGPFCVNDPRHGKPFQRAEDATLKAADRTARTDAKGRPVLPASGFRGAFRSQVERIARTVGWRACRPDDPADACLVRTGADLSRADGVCVVCRAFGAAGYRSRVAISDFVEGPEAASVQQRQEFVAIDRFTGGGAEHLKFDADTFLAPRLTGTLTLDPGLGVVQLALIARALRDLVDGDITFGSGASKGFGACRATITSVCVPAAVATRTASGDSGLRAAIEAALGSERAVTVTRESPAPVVETWCRVLSMVLEAERGARAERRSS